MSDHTGPQNAAPLRETDAWLLPPRRSLPLRHLSPFKRFHRELRSCRSREQMVNILGFVGWSLGLCSTFFLLCYLFIFVHSFKNVKKPFLARLASGPQFAAACSETAGWGVGSHWVLTSRPYCFFSVLCAPGLLCCTHTHTHLGFMNSDNFVKATVIPFYR